MDKIFPSAAKSGVIYGDKYNGLDLYVKDDELGYSKNTLDSIINLFNYVDALKNFSPIFTRFDFPAESTEDNVKRFFDKVKKHHQRKDEPFFYMYTREFDSTHKHEHFHAFCIVNHNSYISGGDVHKMLWNLWWSEVNRNDVLKARKQEIDSKNESEDNDKYNNPNRKTHKHVQIWRTSKPRGYEYMTEETRAQIPKPYNFYSLSTYGTQDNEYTDGIINAFRAASYMAKLSQNPGTKDIEGNGKRNCRPSSLKKLTLNDIRPGYDINKIKKYIAQE